MRVNVEMVIVGLAVNLMACADAPDAVGEDVEIVTQARCNGYADRKNSTLDVNGSVYVQETPHQGTCDGNNTYTADLRSMFNGWRATVWIQNNGVWAFAATGYNTVPITYSYRDDNSHSEMHFCLDNGATFICGWGPSYVVGTGVSHRYTGISHGF
jgi:hypothetical protein